MLRRKVASKPETVTAAAVVEHLSAANLNCLAIDFDHTLIDIHTGGCWKGTLEELTPHFRPIFTDLLTAALDSASMQVAVVTFSRQPDLIRRVLDTAIGNERAARIVIRGNDPSWTYEGRGSQHGKQPHMASAVEELEQSSHAKITKSSTLLIDDDQRNVKIALENGVRAVLFLPKRPEKLLRDLMLLS